MLIAPSTRHVRISPPLLPACPLWIQLFHCGMPSPFPPLLQTPTPSRHLSFGGWPLYFSGLSASTFAPAPPALTTGNASSRAQASPRPLSSADSGHRGDLCFLSNIEQKCPHQTSTLLLDFAKRI